MLTGSINKRKVKEAKWNEAVAMVFVVSSWTGLRMGSGTLILVLVLVSVTNAGVVLSFTQMFLQLISSLRFFCRFLSRFLCRFL